MAAEVSKEAISNSLRKMQEYVLENIETVSAKQVRVRIEEDLQLPAGSLKSQREYIEKLTLKLIEKHEATRRTDSGGARQEQDPAAANKQTSPVKAASKPKASKVKPEKASNSQVEKASKGKVEKMSKASKHARSRHDEQENKKPKKRSKEPSKLTEGKREYSRAVQRMQAMCKQVAIGIPPAVWQKARLGDRALEEAFEELLGKHDLGPRSSSHEVERARRSLATQRDLDGIDTSNIVSSRRRAAAPRVNYALAAGPASSDDSDLEEQDEGEIDSASEAASMGDEPGDDDDARAAASRPGKKKGLGKRTQRMQQSDSDAGESADTEQDSLGGDVKADGIEAIGSDRPRAALCQAVKNDNEDDNEAGLKRRRGLAALSSDDDIDDDIAPQPGKAAATPADTAAAVPAASIAEPAGLSAARSPANSGKAASPDDQPTKATAGCGTAADTSRIAADEAADVAKTEAEQPQPQPHGNLEKASAGQQDSGPPVKPRRAFMIASDEE